MTSGKPVYSWDLSAAVKVVESIYVGPIVVKVTKNGIIFVNRCLRRDNQTLDRKGVDIDDNKAFKAR